MPSDLDEFIERLSNGRKPDNAHGEISSNDIAAWEGSLLLWVKTSHEVGDWLEGIAKEIGVSRSELVTAVFNDGLEKLRNADAETERATPANPAAPSGGLGTKGPVRSGRAPVPVTPPAPGSGLGQIRGH